MHMSMHMRLLYKGYNSLFQTITQALVNHWPLDLDLSIALI